MTATTFNHPLIPVRRQQRIDRAMQKLKAWEHAPAYSKDAIAASVATSRARLQQERDDMVAKLDQGEKWLQDHLGHADFAKYEDRWVDWLRQYEALCDAVTSLDVAA